MKKLFVAIAMLAFAAGCTKKDANDAGCAVQKTVVKVTSEAIGTQLACKNVEAIAAAVEEQVAKLNVCKPQDSISAQGALGSLVCKPLVDGLAIGALSKLPTEWGCTGGEVTDAVKAKLLEVCQKAM